MVSFFKRTLPGQGLLLVVFFLLLRAPLLWLGIPETLPELKLQLVGERMSSSFVNYRDIFDLVPPVSAGFYWLLDEMFGRSFLAGRLVAAGLVLLQGLRLNSIFNRHGVHTEKTYIPALVYLTFSCIYFELDTLTPLLIGQTFVVFSLRYLITFSKEGYNNSKLFKGGFLLGLAALSFLPLALFLVVALFAIFFFASNAFRSFLLLLCGFLFPYTVVMTYYLYRGGLEEFILLQWLPTSGFELNYLLAPSMLLQIMALPLAVLLLSFFSISAGTAQRLNFQLKFQQLMYIWLFVVALIAFFSETVSASALLLFLPVVAYFSVFLFNRRSRAWLADVLFLLVLAGVAVLRYSQPLGLEASLGLNPAPLLIPERDTRPIPPGVPILVLGEANGYYHRNPAATPYLNWQVAQEHFNNLTSYRGIFELHQNLQHDLPDYIIDQQKLMPELQLKIPAVFGQYVPTEKSYIYRRKP